MESDNELICPSQDTCRPLVFIAHDLGGIIVKMVRHCKPTSHDAASRKRTKL